MRENLLVSQCIGMKRWRSPLVRKGRIFIASIFEPYLFAPGDFVLVSLHVLYSASPEGKGVATDSFVASMDFLGCRLRDVCAVKYLMPPSQTEPTGCFQRCKRIQPFLRISRRVMRRCFPQATGARIWICESEIKERLSCSPLMRHIKMNLGLSRGRKPLASGGRKK